MSEAWTLKQQADALTLTLSYGYGISDVDDSIPASEAQENIWFGPEKTADVASPEQPLEFRSRTSHRAVQLDVWIDVANLIGAPPGATIDIFVSLNGGATPIKVTIPTGVTFHTGFTTDGNLAVAAGDTVGVAFETSQAMDDSSKLRATVVARFI